MGWKWVVDGYMSVQLHMEAPQVARHRGGERQRAAACPTPALLPRRCLLPGCQAPIWGNPLHPYCIAGNVAWLVLFGWGLALAHVAAALVQAATVIGLPTALTQLQLAMFVL